MTVGRYGENLACDFLASRGFKVIRRNERVGRKEIDIIALGEGKIVFVEVKTLAMANRTPAEESLSRRQLETIKKAIQGYCWCHKINPKNSRLDFMSINLDRNRRTAKLKHYRDIN